MYQDHEGWHRHKCEDCNCIWEHPDAMSGNTEAHACPGCGKDERYKYTGRHAPQPSKPRIRNEVAKGH